MNRPKRNEATHTAIVRSIDPSIGPLLLYGVIGSVGCISIYIRYINVKVPINKAYSYILSCKLIIMISMLGKSLVMYHFLFLHFMQKKKSRYNK